MDPSPLLLRISRLLQTLLLSERKAKFHKANFQTLVSCIQLLTPVVDEIQASKALMTGQVVQAFEGLKDAFLEAVELLDRCSGKTSRFLLVLRPQQTVLQFQTISLNIQTSLDSLPLSTLELSDNAKKQVEDFFNSTKNASYVVCSPEEDLGRDTEVALKEVHNGNRLSNEKLTDLRERFGFRSNLEILREASFLEKEKDHTRFGKNKLEEDFINRMIALALQMSDDLSGKKAAEDSQRGLSIPADFRCPLSLELMSDPVIVASGQTYEKACIQQWLDQGNTTCPRTRQPLSHRNLIPNYTVKALIANWCAECNIPLPEATKLANHELEGISSLVLNEVESVGLGDMKEASNASSVNADSTVTPMNCGRQHVRPVHMAKSSREAEDHNVDGIGIEDDCSPFRQRNMIDRQPDAKHQRITSQDGELVTEQGHSRNTSSSSFASSLDDAQTNPTFDEANLEAPQFIDDSSRYNSDASGELDRLSTPARVAAHLENRSSPVRLIDRGLVSWRKRNEEHDSKNTFSSTSDTAGVDGESIQLKVEKLVDELHSSYIEKQRIAAAELRLLAKYNMENRIIIANCGAIGPLVSLLESTDAETQENVVTALLNLSINDNNKNEIASAGAIDPLVTVLKVGTSEAKENAAATLFSLSVMDENKVAIGQSGAIVPLVDLLMNGTPRGKKDAATALFNLSINPDNKARIVRAGAVRPLVNLMADPAAGMVDKAVAVLANLATTQDGRCSIGEEGGIPALVEVVELGSQRGKENAAAALLLLCTHSSRFRAMVLQEGAIPPLVALSQTGTARAKEKASALLRLFREQRHPAMGRGGMDRHMDRHFDRT